MEVKMSTTFSTRSSGCLLNRSRKAMFGKARVIAAGKEAPVDTVLETSVVTRIKEKTNRL